MKMMNTFIQYLPYASKFCVNLLFIFKIRKFHRQHKICFVMDVCACYWLRQYAQRASASPSVRDVPRHVSTSVNTPRHFLVMPREALLGVLPKGEAER